MTRTRRALCLGAVLVGLGAGDVRADDGDGVVKWGRSHWMVNGGASALAPNDSRHIEGYRTAYYYECNNQMPPTCFLVSKLHFWTEIDLGYRRHRFRGHTNVSRWSGIAWSDWTDKRHTMQCYVGSGICGFIRKVPTGKFYGDYLTYRVTRVASPSRFRFRSTACAHGNYIACGVGFAWSPPFRCDHEDKTCSFD